MSQCSVHYVNNCPLCSKGFSAPSPVVALELEPEVQAIIAKQTPAEPSVVLATTTPIISPSETVTDPVAVGVLDKAKKYADACQTARKLEDEVGLLKLQLVNATKDLTEAIEIRNAAKKELSKFVE